MPIFKKIRYSALTFCFFFSFTIIGFFLFSKGFLLTRLELDTKASCSVAAAQENFIHPDHNNHSKSLSAPCPYPPTYKRAVIIIIDALRFDFAFYNQTSALQNDEHSRLPYINKLPIIQELLNGNKYNNYNNGTDDNNHLKNAILFRARSDPPTTTLQRLKAITTGTLPTFVDAGSNFGGLVIKEDNIIHQLIKHGKKIRFMGDDTWMNLFPDAFYESMPFPSFDVWDLHTVDNGVIENLFPSFHPQNLTKWDVLIGHFLGVDHVGHRYGPNHPEMEEKLTQMNKVITKLVQNIDEETILFIMGDHGMDAKGDHGGDSEMEMDTTLLAYSVKPLYNPSSSSYSAINHILHSLKNEYEEGPHGQSSFYGGHRYISQIDFVPTFSLLMGIPIPHASLGMLIPELFLHPHQSQILLKDYAGYNLKQLSSYIKDYAQAKRANKKTSPLYQILQKLESLLDAKNTENYMYQMIKHSKETLRIAKMMWAEFDVHYINLGIIFLIGLSFNTLSFTLNVSVLTVKFFVATILTSTMSYAIVTRQSLFHGYPPMLFSFVLGVSVNTALVFMFKTSFRLISLIEFITIDDLIALFLFIIHVAGAASDSFTVHEEGITLSLIQTLFACLFARHLFREDSLSKKLSLTMDVIGLIVLTRLTGSFSICRPEQAPNCIVTFNAGTQSSLAPLWSLVLYFLVNVFFEYAFQQLPRVINAIRWGNFFYWTLDTLEGHRMIPSTTWFTFVKLESARVIYIWIIITLIIRIFNYKVSCWTRSEWIHFSLAGLCLFQKPVGAIALSIGMLQLELFSRLSVKFQYNAQYDAMTVPVIFYLLSHRLYFATGHQNTFQSIQWDVGFIGITNVNWILSPLMITLNTFGSYIFITLYAGKDPKHLSVLLCLFTIYGTFTTAMVGHLRRHLMVWPVFAPKFIFSAFTVCLVQLLILIKTLFFSKLTGVSGGTKF